MKKKLKTLIFVVPTLLLTIVAYCYAEDDPPLFCYDGTELFECAKYGAASTSLVNPPNGSATLSFSGNQAVKITLKNLNVLMTGVTVSSNYQNPPSANWFAILVPGVPQFKEYSVLGHVPIGWKFDISTISDAANVSIAAKWPLWK